LENELDNADIKIDLADLREEPVEEPPLLSFTSSLFLGLI